MTWPASRLQLSFDSVASCCELNLNLPYILDNFEGIADWCLVFLEQLTRLSVSVPYGICASVRNEPLDRGTIIRSVSSKLYTEIVVVGFAGTW